MGEAEAAGDATGEGLTTGLGFVVGAVALAGDDDVAGGVVVLPGELVSGSAAQPDASASARIIGTRRLTRVTKFILDLLIGCASFRQG